MHLDSHLIVLAIFQPELETIALRYYKVAIFQRVLDVCYKVVSFELELDT